MSISNVLIVDDSRTETMFLTDLLQRKGFKVRSALNGEEAMQRLHEEKPDLILMDVVMPGLNGYQATRTLTRDDETKTIPIIVCTTKGQETDKIWGLRQGAVDYLVKPLNADELLQRIAALP